MTPELSDDDEERDAEDCVREESEKPQLRRSTRSSSRTTKITGASIANVKKRGRAVIANEGNDYMEEDNEEGSISARRPAAKRRKSSSSQRQNFAFVEVSSSARTAVFAFLAP
jgi:hypothetical protein